MLKKKSSVESVKVRPPFPKLEIFNVSAIILSYMGHQDEIISLLNLLNLNTQCYAERHFEILQSFITWRPEITRVLSFGQTIGEEEKCDSFYPNNEELLGLKDQKMKLVAIHYTHNLDIGSLYSIQMEFANGFKTPLFETRDARDE